MAPPRRRGLVAVLAGVSAAAILLAACLPAGPFPSPRTNEIAGLTSPPDALGESTTGTPAPQPHPSASAAARPTPGPVAPTAPPGIVAGSVDRTSLRLGASYAVKAAIAVDTGAIEVTTLLSVRNDSGDGIDRLELNTIAAVLGGIRITEASVDDDPAEVTIDDQTLIVPLGGVLPPGGVAKVRIGYAATLTRGHAGSDWMFSRAEGVFALYRWIPWISRATPFDRPNHGDPFVTATASLVQVEVLTDQPMILAAPDPEVIELAAGDGRDWSITARNVRDLAIVLARDFVLTEGAAGGVPIRVYSRAGGSAGKRLLDLAVHALTSEADRLGVAYPWPVLTVVETAGGYALESPGLIWIPDNLDSRNRTYFVHHEVAHQWFYGLVGSDQQREPFADEAAADLLARTVLDTLRPTRCPPDTLDRTIRRYSATCYYEVIYVQGGLLLDQVRRQMGATAFWAAMAAYVEANRYAIAGTRTLLDALEAAGGSDLRSLFRARFPSLY